jgi:hypothetical protein
MAIPRIHGVKSLELRATMSLARLVVQREQPDEARTMLAEIEGFDTADPKDARLLLDQLSK